MASNPELQHCKQDEYLRHAESISFWREMNPHLTISDDPFAKAFAPFDYVTEGKEVAQVKDEGYFHINPVIPVADCEAIAKGVLRIVERGAHPLFVLLYDEYWQLIPRLGRILEPILGPDYRAVGDFWAWCVSPTAGPCGWSIHRDSWSAAELRDDGRPHRATIWIPFTDATPSNGCMYLVPTNRDENLPDNRTSYSVKNLQDVRALPASAGSILGWNQDVLHWGGRCSPYAPNPRISIAIYVESSEAKPYRPNVRIDFQAALPFQRRLAMIGAMIGIYQSTFYIPEKFANTAKKWTSILD